MLKGIDPRISPELLRDLAAMGHRETLLVADGNFPVGRLAGSVHHVAVGTLAALDAILSLVPLEIGHADAVVVRAESPGAPLDALQELALQHIREIEPRIDDLLRPALGEFVERALGAAVAVITTDAAPSCFVLTRGVI
jgi:L-fucose mutarotase